jgi:hypothetical protein
MAGLDPAIYDLGSKDVDARVKRGHDDSGSALPRYISTLEIHRGGIRAADHHADALAARGMITLR